MAENIKLEMPDNTNVKLPKNVANMFVPVMNRPPGLDIYESAKPL